jgi:hypothetical protein
MEIFHALSDLVEQSSTGGMGLTQYIQRMRNSRVISNEPKNVDEYRDWIAGRALSLHTSRAAFYKIRYNKLKNLICRYLRRS